jgi:hypothetical protein
MLPRMDSTTARSNPPAEVLILCRNVHLNTTLNKVYGRGQQIYFYKSLFQQTAEIQCQK